jgi:coniferyl-aldehyde dehydrogenase
MLAVVNDNQPRPEVDELRQDFELMRRASRHNPVPNRMERRANLLLLRDILELHSEELVEAVSEDFGWRSPHETRFADLGLVLSAINDAIRHLKKWMRDEGVRMPMHHLPARGRITRVPLGVVGVIGPWNYPIQLTLVPVINALAAGNRVLLKPSELCARTSALLKSLINESFPGDVMRVHTGDASFGAAFASLRFDHLFFTGSTAVGRMIAAAAAPNLTPVTLELGGKSPAIVTDAASLERTADAIAWGKCLNAGQTCVAPDYVLVTAGQREQLIAKIDQSFRRRFGQWWKSGDYTSIISARHHERLERLVGDAADKGARGVPLGETPPFEAEPIAPRMLQPLILVDPDPASAVMQEEIFGPVLPVITVKDLNEAIVFVAERPRPLALYLFTEDKQEVAKVQQQLVAGGMLINDTIWHVALDSMPFGGVGESGMGDYHGEDGFLTFTKRMPIYIQSRWTGTGVMRPPYGWMFEQTSNFLRWWERA